MEIRFEQQTAGSCPIAGCHGAGRRVSGFGGVGSGDANTVRSDGRDETGAGGCAAGYSCLPRSDGPAAPRTMIPDESFMSTAAVVARAVRNNALWCDATCRAHGWPGEFHDAYWINHGAVPPYTSKLITLAGEAQAADQRAAIEGLMRAEPDSYFSVKDAFQCLDLAPLGFGVLFHATWIQWAPDQALPRDPAERLEWTVVRGAGELIDWEQAWRGSPANAAADGTPRVFPPSLLDEPGLHFLAGRRGGTVVASGALNRTGDVVGLSNLFSGRPDVGPLFPGSVRLAQTLNPGVPIVGYERGDDLRAAEQAGFARVADLTVWQRVAP